VSLAVKQCHHGVARDARLLDVPKVALPNLSHSFIKPSNAGVPLVGIRVEDALRHIHHELVVAELEHTVDIASIQPLEIWRTISTFSCDIARGVSRLRRGVGDQFVARSRSGRR